MSIVVKEVTKTFGQQNALDSVSFSIKTGEIVGFLGPNGAGKSTMMKIITGFLPQTSGDVLVNDINVLENSLEVRRHLGYLPESNPLYTDMYVREYLEFVAGIYKLGKQTRSKVDEMIERTGLTKEQHKKIGELSKGYRQRVGLAQALIHDPEVLILDEPTSGLDPNQIVEIRSLIAEVGRKKTVMLSTHIMQEVEAICERILIINNGIIVADDRTDRIQQVASQASQVLLVEFDKAVDEKKLKNLDGIIRLTNTGQHQFSIAFNPEYDIRPAIFDFAVKNGHTVLSMQIEKKLEEIFQELTRK